MASNTSPPETIMIASISGCYFSGRGEDMTKTDFEGRDAVLVTLQGYAIVPLESYEELTAEVQAFRVKLANA
jgi:hypothetical protein